MSVAAKKWVRQHARVQGSQRAVLAELAWAGDDRGHGARLSHGQLAQATGLSRRTVQRALAQLEAEDHIRRHTGGPDHCDACARAERGVVVFDVVIPEHATVSLPGQLTLLAGGVDQRHDVRHDQRQMTQVVTPVANRHQRHGDAGTCATVTHLEEKEDVEGQQQQPRTGGRTPAREGGGLAAAVARVIETLRRCPRLFIDEYAIEGALMRADGQDVDQAAAAVVALASDPAYRLPKGGAAMMLIYQLQRQQPRTRFPDLVADTSSARPARRFEPAAAAVGAGEFSKYDRAMGLA